MRVDASRLSMQTMIALALPAPDACSTSSLVPSP